MRRLRVGGDGHKYTRCDQQRVSGCFVANSGTHGIIPHSNSLLATGPATLLMNICRICGSLRRKFTASCSRCPLGCPLSAHNCSHEEFWYFWITLLATLSSNGCWSYCAPATPANSSNVSTAPKR